jgi:iron complex transport system substrate-binding protein
VFRNLTRIGLLVALMVALFAASGFAPASAQTSIATPGASPVPQLPVTVKDVNGKSITVTDISRIVPLSGDVAEIIYDLGLGPNVVGADVSAVYPAGYFQKLPSIGFEQNLSAEGILALNPTVVIGKAGAGPQAVLDQVAAAGVPVVIINAPDTIDAPVSKINDVAAALGVPAAGAALANQTQQEITSAEAFASQATSKPKVLFLYVRAGGTQLIGGKGSVADSIIAAAGGIDAGVAAGVQGFEPVTAEAVVAAEPDFIVVPQSGLDSIGGMSAFLKIPGVADTPAAKNGKILAFDDLELLDMTPRTGAMIELLAQAIHPELPQATPVATPAA